MTNQRYCIDIPEGHQLDASPGNTAAPAYVPLDAHAPVTISPAQASAASQGQTQTPGPNTTSIAAQDPNISTQPAQASVTNTTTESNEEKSPEMKCQGGKGQEMPNEMTDMGESDIHDEDPPPSYQQVYLQGPPPYVPQDTSVAPAAPLSEYERSLNALSVSADMTYTDTDDDISDEDGYGHPVIVSVTSVSAEEGAGEDQYRGETDPTTSVLTSAQRLADLDDSDFTNAASSSPIQNTPWNADDNELDDLNLYTVSPIIGLSPSSSPSVQPRFDADSEPGYRNNTWSSTPRIHPSTTRLLDMANMEALDLPEPVVPLRLPTRALSVDEFDDSEFDIENWIDEAHAEITGGEADRQNADDGASPSNRTRARLLSGSTMDINIQSWHHLMRHAPASPWPAFPLHTPARSTGTLATITRWWTNQEQIFADGELRQHLDSNTQANDNDNDNATSASASTGRDEADCQRCGCSTADCTCGEDADLYHAQDDRQRGLALAPDSFSENETEDEDGSEPYRPSRQYQSEHPRYAATAVDGRIESAFESAFDFDIEADWNVESYISSGEEADLESEAESELA